MFTFNDQDAQVQALLNDSGIKYSFIYCGEVEKDKWLHDAWRVGFEDTKTGKKELFEYSTGTGHRIQGRPSHSAGTVTFKPELRKNLDNHLEALGLDKRVDKIRFLVGQVEIIKGEKRATFTTVPTAASVLYCLLLDADAINESFFEWCDSFGYDNDSMKAHSIYLACQGIARKLNNVFSSTIREQLQEILQDY